MQNRGIWSEGSASIVLLPSGENGARLFELAKEWTDTGLLRPAMWLDLDQVQLHENAPPQVPVNVLGLSPDRELHQIEVDLFEQLSQHELKIVRIVGLRYLTDDKSTHVRQNSLVRDVGHYLERSLPLPVNQTGQKDPKTRFLRFNLVVHPTQLNGVEQDQVLEGSWEANLIVSPEDRRSPWTADAFVRTGTQLDAFALAHIATTAGLWNGLPSGAYDQIATGEGQSGRIIVPRLFVRAVSSDGLARRVSSKVLRQFSKSDSSTRAGSLSLAIPGTRAIPELQIMEYQDWVLENIMRLDDGRLQYGGISPIPTLPKLRMLEVQQLTEFFSFAWDKVRQIPKWTWQSLRANFGRRLTRKFQGEDGLATVGIEIDNSPDARDQALIGRFNQIQEQSLRVDNNPSEIQQGKVLAESSPALWAGIRKLFFGMLDGSDLPGIVQHPEYEDERLVFESVKSLVFDPEERWEFTPNSDEDPENVLSIQDIDSIEQMQQDLEDWTTSSREVLLETSTRLDQVNSEIDQLRHKLISSEVTS
jgi:hypothetical protein